MATVNEEAIKRACERARASLSNRGVTWAHALTDADMRAALAEAMRALADAGFHLYEDVRETVR